MKQQQLHCKWFKFGDRNTEFFHSSIKIKQAKENIRTIRTLDGTHVSSPQQIDAAFLSYFEDLLGNSSNFSPDLDTLNDISLSTISSLQSSLLVDQVTDEEIKHTLYAMNRKSSGGPDGFNVHFFISCWEIVRYDFCKAVHNFFNKCSLLFEVNSTNIVLIPKYPDVSSVIFLQTYFML